MITDSSAPPKLPTSASIRSATILFLGDTHTLVSVKSLPESSQMELKPLLDGIDAEALLVPRDATSSSVLPLNGVQRQVFEAMTKGCPWQTVVSTLSAEGCERLIAMGILRGEFEGLSLTGPALALLLREERVDGALPEIQTDTLSGTCLAHVARMPFSDLTSVATRLYLYNSFGVYQSEGLVQAVEDVARIVSRPPPQYLEVLPPAFNPGWHFFSQSAPKRRRNTAGGSNCKVYLSPSIDDTAQCLSRFIELLPLVNCQTWKVGRGAYGISRSDKICIYFSNEAEGLDTAAILARELLGVRAQGIPFTNTFDANGLISLGADPPAPSRGASEDTMTSWRDWVTRKLAGALLLARRSPTSILSPEQSALWTLKILGVDPSSWRAENSDFWRN